MKLAWLAGAVHMYVRVETPNGDVTLERYGDGTIHMNPFNSNRGGTPIQVDNPSYDPCDKSYAFENNILNEFNNLANNPSSLPPYLNEPEIMWTQVPGQFAFYPTVVGGTFNNSNTFANWLITNAGGSLTGIPNGAWGANSNFKRGDK